MKLDEDFTTPGMLVIPTAAMAWSFARSAGAGGQHINKTSSKATLVISIELVTGPPRSITRLRSVLKPQVRTSSQQNRSQWRNRQHCLDRIAEILDAAAKPPAPPRRKTRPTRGAIERRLESKRRDSKTKATRRSTDWWSLNGSHVLADQPEIPSIENINRSANSVVWYWEYFWRSCSSPRWTTLVSRVSLEIWQRLTLTHQSCVQSPMSHRSQSRVARGSSARFFERCKAEACLGLIRSIGIMSVSADTTKQTGTESMRRSGWTVLRIPWSEALSRILHSVIERFTEDSLSHHHDKQVPVTTNGVRPETPLKLV